MAFERFWASVSPRALTADGSSVGYFTVADISGFYVKQRVFLQSSSQAAAQFQIKRIDVDTNRIWLGPGNPNEAMTVYSDLSAFLLADGAFAYAEHQDKSKVPIIDQEQATYETEPIVAKRVILVDEEGKKYNENNPLPVNATVSVVVPPIAVELDALTPPTQANPDNAMIVGSINGTKAGTKYGWVNNVKQQIMAAHDRKRDAFYLDLASKKDRRLDKFEYTSPTFPGVTLVRQFSWTLVGTEYVYENDEWSVI